MQLTAPSLFAIGGLRAYELKAESMAELQTFFDANPLYFEAVGGAPAVPTEAIDEFESEPPKGWSFTKKWLLGFVDESNSLMGMASVVSDLLANSVWHIDLYIIATSRHGRGDAKAVYEALERWATSNGAMWLRLGVVAGNVRAERFWERAGFVEVRSREGVEIGIKVNTIRVMSKALAGGSVAEYLALVARDRPEPPMRSN
jgi:GNAT superfamily N-acetyltransferase